MFERFIVVDFDPELEFGHVRKLDEPDDGSYMQLIRFGLTHKVQACYFPDTEEFGWQVLTDPALMERVPVAGEIIVGAVAFKTDARDRHFLMNWTFADRYDELVMFHGKSVVYYVPVTDEFVLFTDMPFTVDGYEYVEGDDSFRVYIGTVVLQPAIVDYVETYHSSAGPYGIDTLDGSIVIYPKTTTERHPGLHGRWKGRRMTRLNPEQYTLVVTPDGPVVTMK